MRCAPAAVKPAAHCRCSAWRSVAHGIERRADVPDVESAVLILCDRHDVEATPHAVEPAPLEIELRKLGEPALLVPRDGGGRCVVPPSASALHLDEDHHAVVTTYEIDLAGGEAD